MHKNYAKKIYNEIISHGPSMKEIFEYSNQVQNKVVYTKKFHALDIHTMIIYDLNAKDGYDIAIYPSLCDIGTMFTATQQVVGLLVKLDENKEAVEVRINSKQNTKNRLEALDKTNTNDIRYIRFFLSDNNRKLRPFLINIKAFCHYDNMTKDDLRPWGDSTIAEGED